MEESTRTSGTSNRSLGAVRMRQAPPQAGTITGAHTKVPWVASSTSHLAHFWRMKLVLPSPIPSMLRIFPSSALSLPQHLHKAVGLNFALLTVKPLRLSLGLSPSSQEHNRHSVSLALLISRDSHSTLVFVCCAPKTKFSPSPLSQLINTTPLDI